MSQLVPQLQRLQATLRADERLGSVVLQERIAEILAKAEKITKHKMFIRDERRRVRAEAEELEERKKAMKYLQEADWIPNDLQRSTTESTGKRLKLVVGGMPFEITTAVASRDRGSLLFALTSEVPPVAWNSKQQFVFDRDWWLFRHIVKFLRDGSLPDEEHLLAQIYREATFWKLSSLKRAIESNKLNIRSSQGAQPNSVKQNTEWWRTSPSWWRTVDEKRSLPIEGPQRQDIFMSWWSSPEVGFRNSSLLNGKKQQQYKDGHGHTINPTGEVTRMSLSSTWNVPAEHSLSYR